jgi:hypothetical protein
MQKGFFYKQSKPKVVSSENSSKNNSKPKEKEIFKRGFLNVLTKTPTISEQAISKNEQQVETTVVNRKAESKVEVTPEKPFIYTWIF